MDNDGDGEVDEGFPDADSNGRKDCLDAECPALVPGAVNYAVAQHTSGTVFEYPTVADMDADDHGEIAYCSNYGAPWGVLKVVEHDGGGWPAAGSTWAVHDFAITNVNADGSVPASPDPFWTKYNVYRSRTIPPPPTSWCRSPTCVWPIATTG